MISRSLGSITLKNFGGLSWYVPSCSCASAEDYVPQVQPAKDGAYLIEGACSHTEVAPYLEQYVKPDAANWRTLDDVAKTLDNCISKLAETDKTVNTKFFRELVM